MSALLAAAMMVVVAAYGFPWVVLTRSHARPARAMAVALAGGTANLALLSLLLMQLRILNIATILVVAGILVLIAVLYYRRNLIGEDEAANPMTQREQLLEGLLVLGISAIALWARRQPINFVFQTGDMGEYVNNANEIARGERLGASFPHLFSNFLATSRALFGYMNTAVIVPAIGAILAVVPLALVRRLGGSLPVAGLAGLVIAISPFPVWFGIFPASEALMATLLVGAFYALLTATDEGSSWLATLAGVLVGAAAFTRGTGLVFVALPALAMVFVMDKKPEVRRAAVAFAVTAAAFIAAAAIYNFTATPGYMNLQVRNIMGPDFPTIPAWTVAVAGAAFVGLIAGSVRVLSRHRLHGRWLQLLPILLLVAALIVHRVLMNNAGLLVALDNFGLPILVTAAVGLVALWPPRGWPPIPPLVGTQIVTVAAIGSILYASRVPEEIYHSYWQYWDRYTYSELFPVVVFMMGVGLAVGEFAVGAAFDKWMHSDKSARYAKRTVNLGVAMAAAITIYWAVPQLTEINRFKFFGESDAVVEELAEAAGTDTIYYTGSRLSSAWFFRNTYRAFGSPLQSAFGISIPNLEGFGPFERDPDLSLGEIADEARLSGATSATVIQANLPKDLNALRAECMTHDGCTYLETIDLHVPWRKSRIDALDPWVGEDIRFNVYRLDLTDPGLADDTAPWDR